MASPYLVNLPEKLDTLLAQVTKASGIASNLVLLDWIQNPITPSNSDSLKAYNLIQLWTLVYRAKLDMQYSILYQIATAELEKRGEAIEDLSLNAITEDLTKKSDDDLWQLAEQSLDYLRQVAEQMTVLTRKKHHNSLSDLENEELEFLAEAYEWYTLLRAKILAELQDRNYDIQAYLEGIAPI